MLIKRMGLITAVLILFFLGFNSVTNLSVSRKNVENSGSRSFITFKTNLINQKACNCTSTSSCSCCESVKIFYTHEEKQLCFNMIYQRNGLNFDLTLDSLMIKAMTVANYKPFRMCSSVPGLLFTMICVQILELNQFERSITVCPRVEVISSKERWQINYICNSISTVLPALAPPVTMMMGMPVMQMLPMNPPMDDDQDDDDEQMMSPAAGQQPEMTQMPNSPPTGQPPVTDTMEEAPAPTATGRRPVTATMGQAPAPTATGQRPVTTTMGQASAPTPTGQRPATAATGQIPPTTPIRPAATPVPGQTPAAASMVPQRPAPTGQMLLPMAMIQIPSVSGINPAGGAMIIISGMPPISGQNRPASPVPGAAPGQVPPAGVIMPRPANGMMLILRPSAKSKLIFEPDEFEIKTLSNLTEVKQDSDVVANEPALNENSKEKVTNFNVEESITYSIKSDSVSKSIDETLENEHKPTGTTIVDKSLKSLKRRKRNYDIFEAFHQSDRCERAYKICVTKSRNYIVSRVRNSRNKNKCSNKPARIVYGSEEDLCLDSDLNGSSATLKPPESQYAAIQTNDSLDAIIIHDESTENYDFNSQKIPFKVTLNPSGRPSIFPLRTPPLIALQMKDVLSKIANDSHFEIEPY